MIDRMHGAKDVMPGIFRLCTSVSNACIRARMLKSRRIDPYSTSTAESPALRYHCESISLSPVSIECSPGEPRLAVSDCPDSPQ